MEHSRAADDATVASSTDAQTVVDGFGNRWSPPVSTSTRMGSVRDFVGEVVIRQAGAVVPAERIISVRSGQSRAGSGDAVGVCGRWAGCKDRAELPPKGCRWSGRVACCSRSPGRCCKPLSRRKWPTIWDTTAARPRRRAAATNVMAVRPRRCAPRWVRCAWMCRGIGQERLPGGLCPNTLGRSTGSTRPSSRCMPRV